MKFILFYKKFFLNIFLPIFYEIWSYFIPEKTEYKIIGNCKKCGECCRRMYSFDTYDERDFDLMKKIFPKYRRFEIVDKEEDGTLVFRCNLVGKDGLCTVYNNRLKMCKIYPFYKVKWGVSLPEHCGFKIVSNKKFEDYLK